MRRVFLRLVCSAAMLLPKIGSAQAYQVRTPPPQVTAAEASWQISGEPIFHAGSLYYPTGPTVFFDANVMVRTGSYQGVSLYADTTLEPYSIVYVPIGRNLMRPYEKPRSGELAGTVGSRMPSFPIQRDAEVSAATGVAPGTVPAQPPASLQQAAIPAPQPVATAGVEMVPLSVLRPADRSRPRTNLQLVPSSRANAGIWIEFNGMRWRSAGQTVSYSSDRFIAIGEYRGFPVYRDLRANADEIYIPAVHDGALTRYRK